MSSKNSEKTRENILLAAWKLLESDSGAQTRMVDIAREAGVSRQAVYLHFPSRVELLMATTRYIDKVEDVAGRMAAIDKAEGAEQRLHAFVNAWGNYIPVVHGVASTLIALEETDSDAAQAWEDRMKLLNGICDSIVKELRKENKLAKDMTMKEASHVMWTLISVQFWELLTIKQGFTQQRYLELVEKMVRDVVIDRLED